MNSELTAKDIATWHREQAKRHEEIAKRHTDMAASVEQDFDAPGTNWRRISSVPPPRPNRVNPVTAAEFEDAVREKTGHVKDLAKRLKTDPAAIEGLLEPASRVYKGQRGWLFVRD
jgi:hypothetical protein